MNQREKILALVTGGCAALFVGYFAIHGLFIAPAQTLTQQAASLSEQVTELEAKNAREQQQKRVLVDVARHSYGQTVQQANEQVRARLVQLVSQAGLNPQHVRLTTHAGRRISHTYQAFGWSLSIRGPLDKVVNLLFLLQRQPRVHRIDDLSLGGVPHSRDINLRLTYSSLVLQGTKQRLPAPLSDDKLQFVSLDAADRALYQPAVARDIFRPFTNAPPRIVQTSDPEPSEGTTEVATPGLSVVSLSQLNGRPQVLLRDDSSGATQTLHVGDMLAGGVIAAVDYRQMSQPGGHLLSPSRLILRMGTDFWAVELGQHVSDRHALAAADLPASLRQATPATTQPGTPAAEDASPVAVRRDAKSG